MVAMYTGNCVGNRGFIEYNAHRQQKKWGGYTLQPHQSPYYRTRAMLISKLNHKTSGLNFLVPGVQADKMSIKLRLQYESSISPPALPYVHRKNARRLKIENEQCQSFARVFLMQKFKKKSEIVPHIGKNKSEQAIALKKSARIIFRKTA